MTFPPLPAQATFWMPADGQGKPFIHSDVDDKHVFGDKPGNAEIQFTEPEYKKQINVKFIDTGDAKDTMNTKTKDKVS